MSHIAILPARGGSKRIPGKNIMDFSGKPMISYPLEAAKISGLFSKIHVSTDNDLIAETVTSLGFEIDFMRTPELADDFTGVLDVARFVLDEYKKRGQTFESFALIMPCSPFLTPDDLKRGYETYHKFGARQPVLSVCEYNAPIEWAFEIDLEGALQALHPEKLAFRSQDFSKKYYDTGTFSIQNAKHVLESSEKVPSKFLPCPIPKRRAIDIDNREDLSFAAALYQTLLGR